MNVFLLTLKIMPPGEVFDDDFVTVNPWYYNDVFMSEQEAVAFGKKMLIDRLEAIKPAFGDKSIEDIVDDEVQCTFYVLEFDPNDKRGGRDGRGGHKWEKFVWWQYDHKGNLLDRTVWGEECGYYVLPCDYNEGAGTKFAPGTFVTIEHTDEYYHSEKELNTIYVVFANPGRRNEFRLGPDSWENIYLLGYIDNSGYYEHDHVHETSIHLYDGVVPDDHPLHILKKFAIGELDINDDLWNDIVYKRILLDYQTEQKSWRYIPELKDAV